MGTDDVPTKYSIPTPEYVSEVYMSASFCFFSQIFISVLLLLNFAEQQSVAVWVDWKQQMARFICGALFHFSFEQEIRIALRNMKYVAMHIDEFEHPVKAFFLALMQATSVLFVQVVNIWNLVNIEGIMDIVFDYIALGIVSEFDDAFLEIYRQGKLQPFIGVTLEIKNFYKSKVEVFFDTFRGGEEITSAQANIPAVVLEAQVASLNNNKVAIESATPTISPNRD